MQYITVQTAGSWIGTTGSIFGGAALNKRNGWLSRFGISNYELLFACPETTFVRIVSFGTAPQGSLSVFWNGDVLVFISGLWATHSETSSNLFMPA